MDAGCLGQWEGFGEGLGGGGGGEEGWGVIVALGLLLCL